MNKTKNNYFFEKIFGAFYIFVATFMLVSFFVGKVYVDNALSKNKNEIEINVTDTDLESTIYDGRLQDLISKNTNESNPNIIDASVKDEVLNIINKKQVKEIVILINEDGSLNTDFIQIEPGDFVKFLNHSNKNISIKGEGGWGVNTLDSKNSYVQAFYPVKEYNFTLQPFGTKGIIRVELPD